MDTNGFAKQWASFPPTVRKGIFATALGWLAHWLFLGLFFFNRQEPVPMGDFSRHLILGLLVFFFLWKGKAWGRWLVIAGNVMIMLYYVQWAVLGGIEGLEMLATIIIVASFFVSSYYLLNKETAKFFNRNIKKTDPKGTSSNDSAS